VATEEVRRRVEEVWGSEKGREELKGDCKGTRKGAPDQEGTGVDSRCTDKGGSWLQKKCT